MNANSVTRVRSGSSGAAWIKKTKQKPKMGEYSTISQLLESIRRILKCSILQCAKSYRRQAEIHITCVDKPPKQTEFQPASLMLVNLSGCIQRPPLRFICHVVQDLHILHIAVVARCLCFSLQYL